MTDSLLLDTCAVIWISEGVGIAEKAASILDDAADAGTPVLVSPITAWEVGMMVSKNRVKLSSPPVLWFNRFLDRGMKLAKMSVEVLVASSHLPARSPGDPADRIIIATAREFDYRIVTRDRQILDFAKAGHVNALAC